MLGALFTWYASYSFQCTLLGSTIFIQLLGVLFNIENHYLDTMLKTDARFIVYLVSKFIWGTFVILFFLIWFLLFIFSYYCIFVYVSECSDELKMEDPIDLSAFLGRPISIPSADLVLNCAFLELCLL